MGARRRTGRRGRRRRRRRSGIHHHTKTNGRCLLHGTTAHTPYPYHTQQSRAPRVQSRLATSVEDALDYEHRVLLSFSRSPTCAMTRTRNFMQLRSIDTHANAHTHTYIPTNHSNSTPRHPTSTTYKYPSRDHEYLPSIGLPACKWRIVMPPIVRTGSRRVLARFVAVNEAEFLSSWHNRRRSLPVPPGRRRQLTAGSVSPSWICSDNDTSLWTP